MLPSCQTWRCPWRPETLDGRGARDMRTGKNMGIMTTFKKPTLERGGPAQVALVVREGVLHEGDQRRDQGGARRDQGLAHGLRESALIAA